MALYAISCDVFAAVSIFVYRACESWNLCRFQCFCVQFDEVEKESPWPSKIRWPWLGGVSVFVCVVYIVSRYTQIDELEN